MRILMVHNYYQQAGGEDQVFAAESDLLEQNGHEVHRFTLHNDQINGAGAIAVAGKTLWNRQVYRELRSIMRDAQIEIAHFHNTFPLVSPAAYYAAQAEGVPVVQTIHNYRLLCPNGLLFRAGEVCEDCIGKSVPYPAIQHRCYRDSSAASAAVAAMLTIHRAIRTWRQQVNVFIALTEFAKQKLIQGGVPAEKIVVKPNFVAPDPGIGTGQGGYALFVGRLSQEKGIDTLLTAWKHLGNKLPLKIVGDGPLAQQVAASANQIPGVIWLGRKPMQDVYELMKEAAMLIFPSCWYEGLPRTVIESFAVGTPVIAANLGSMSSLIATEKTGLHFQSGDVNDLVSKVNWALNHTDDWTEMRDRTRNEFALYYTAEKSYQKLTEIYSSLISNYLETEKITL